MIEALQETIVYAVLQCRNGQPYTKSFEKLMIETARRGWMPVVKLTITDPKDDVLADEVVSFCRTLCGIQQPVNEDYEAGARTITLLVA